MQYRTWFEKFQNSMNQARPGCRYIIEKLAEKAMAADGELEIDEEEFNEWNAELPVERDLEYNDWNDDLYVVLMEKFEG